MSSTTDLVGQQSWTSQLFLSPGPIWNSFEDIRRSANVRLGSIAVGSVATLNVKAGTFRILREQDFQRLLGIAADVHRFQAGARVVMQAVEVFMKHPDKEHEELVERSASMLAMSPMLPLREGHQALSLHADEAEQCEDDGFDVQKAIIPTPDL